MRASRKTKGWQKEKGLEKAGFPQCRVQGKRDRLMIAMMMTCQALPTTPMMMTDWDGHFSLKNVVAENVLQTSTSKKATSPSEKAV